MAEDQEILSTAQAARLLGCSPTTLDGWRSNAKGPPYFYIYRMVRYRRSEVELWAFSGPIQRREIEEAAPCHAERRSRTKRARGRAGAELRERRLRHHSFCMDCYERGELKTADEIDHIVPLALGGSDDDDNIRGLCRRHHDERTRELKRQLREMRSAAERGEKPDG